MRERFKHIAIFASGTGSNADSIFKHFRDHPKIRVSLLLSNKPDVPVLEKARHYNIPGLAFDRSTFYQTNEITKIMVMHKIDVIVLAGFMWLVPPYLVKDFNGKILNIHPALLPKYGGKGMYGLHVHEAVVENGEKESGMTIHQVNEKYDDGSIIFQARCNLEAFDTPEQVAAKVLKLEHQHYPKVIENWMLKSGKKL